MAEEMKAMDVPEEVSQTPDPIQTLLYHDQVLSEACKDIYAIRAQLDEIREVVGSMAQYLMEQEAQKFATPGPVIEAEATPVEPKSE